MGKLVWLILSMALIVGAPAWVRAAPAGGDKPPFRFGRSGWPENMIEVTPGRKLEGEVFRSGKRFVWVAIHRANIAPGMWAWTKFGPYDFQPGMRYYSHIKSHGYIVAPDRDPSRSNPGGDSSALSFEVVDGHDTYAFILDSRGATSGAEEHGNASIVGTWEDDSPDLSNSRYTYSQSGNNIQLRGSFVHKGFTCEFSGTGTIKGNKVVHSVTYSKRPPDPAWRGADGGLELTVSPDGKTMTGTWHNNNHDSGAKRLVKRN